MTALQTERCGPGRARRSAGAGPLLARFALLAALLASLLVLAPTAWSQETATAGATTQLRPYHARYAIYRNGKLTGKVEVDVLRQGEGEDAQWAVRSEGSGTHGLARILAARDTEEAIGRMRGGQFRPERYTRHTRVAGIDDRWTVDFDWTARQVSIVHDKHDPLVLEMAGDALDPLSLKLEMRRRLARSDPQLEFFMVEEDEIDEQNFRLLPTEWLETSLGCLATVPVEKVRQNSKRYTRAWHAPDFDFVEMKIEHGKTGGNHLEMRITELTLDGEDILPRPGCSARQAAPATEPADSN